MLTMLRDRVLIKPLPNPKLSEIIFAENKDRTYYGEVVSVGPGRYKKKTFHPVDIKSGDKVIYCNAFKFPEFKENSQTYQLLQEDDILGRIDENDELTPLHDKIVVILDDQSRITDSGIILSIGHDEKNNTGIVIKTGDGKILSDGKKRPLSVESGDRVTFGEMIGHAFEHNSQKLLMMREEDITCVF